MKHSVRIQSLVFTGLGIALLAVSAQIQIPIGLVPVTLQSMVFFIILFVYSPTEAVVTIGGYLLIGAVGFPVGAGFRSGPIWLFGPTGGFLVGFFISAVLVGAIRQLSACRQGGSAGTNSTQPTTQSTVLFDAITGCLSIVLYYVCGVAWLVFSTGTGLMAALMIAVAPFVIPDAIKLVVAISASRAIRLAIGRDKTVVAKPEQ